VATALWLMQSIGKYRTSARLTPSLDDRIVSTLEAQLAQLMPVTENCFFVM